MKIPIDFVFEDDLTVSEMFKKIAGNVAGYIENNYKELPMNNGSYILIDIKDYEELLDYKDRYLKAKELLRKV